MKDCVWGRTVLSVYRYLERICGAIDKLVETRAINSRCYCSSNMEITSVLKVYDALTNLTNRKVKLINLKVLTENAFSKMDAASASLLISKYIDGKSSAEIAEKLGVSTRTYFRGIRIAEKSFELQLAKFGFTSERLFDNYSKETWIMEVFDSLNGDGREEIEVFDNKKFQQIYSEYRIASL